MPRSRLLTIATTWLLVALAAVVTASPLRGQDLEDRLQTLGEENGRLYSHPVNSGLAAGLASGWVHSAEPLEVLGVELSVRAMGSLAPEEDETFEPVLPQELTVDLNGETRTFSQPYGTPMDVKTPTAVGSGTGATVKLRPALRDSLEEFGQPRDQLDLRFPDGFDIPAVPMAVIQGSVGLPGGTEATARWIPDIEIDEDVGTLSSFGFGLKHSVSQWIPGPTPVDVAVEGGIQSFDAGDYLSADSRHVTLVVSRDVGLLTLYGSGGLEESDIDVSYTLENPAPGGEDVEVAFSDEGENSTRLTVGFNLDLLFLQLNAGYTAAEYEVLNASLGLSF